MGRLFWGLGLNDGINFCLAFLNRELRGTHQSEIQHLPAYKNLEFKNLLNYMLVLN